MTKSRKDPSAITVEQNKGEREERAIARIAASPSLQSALTIRDYGSAFGELELMSLVDELRQQIDSTIDGNLERAEAMLTTQAHTLDAIFSNLARRAIRAEYLSNFDTYLKLGLRAQSQCRATWETLANIKNPRLSVNQTNIAQNQQINNVQQKAIQPNKLVEEKPCEKWLDGGAQKEAVRIDVGVDSQLETVGEGHRTANS